MQIAIVTGASSGIGREFVVQMDKKYKDIDEIWVIARRENKLNELNDLCSKKIRTFPIDLTNDTELLALISELKTQNPSVKFLVNSSGFGKIGLFQDISLENNLDMINLNCKSLVKLCYSVLPYMQSGSNIINIASVAAFLPQPKFAIYAASKSFVLSFSRALNIELKSKNIKVLAVCPNPVETEFFTLAGNEQSTKSIKSIGIEKKEQVVSTALKNLDKTKDVSISSPIAKSIRFISKIFPHSWILKIEGLMGVF